MYSGYDPEVLVITNYSFLKEQANTFTASFKVKSLDETLKCDHSNEIYFIVLSCGAVLLCHKKCF